MAVPETGLFHCHMAHHTMNAMGHDLANPVGVEVSTRGARQPYENSPRLSANGRSGMAEHAMHVAMSSRRTRNTLPMMVGQESHMVR